MKKALIAMSGGVDSSVAAYLAQKQGYDCIGCTMKLYDNGASSERTCCSLEDTEDARSVSYRLGMPYYVFGFAGDFQRLVIDKFARSYEAGVTPNPCIDCNRYLKFGRLLERARILGCECVVTGHYARIEHERGRYLLKKALDETKDQSYVLYSMTQEQLSRVLFPLGGMKKTQVRALAREKGFVSAEKPDSQDICFVPDGDYAGFLESYTGKKYPHGDFVSADGRILGTHRGIIRYTVGQRRGLGIAAPEALYVKALDAKENRVILGAKAELYGKSVEAEDFNWIAFDPPKAAFRCRAKLRYRQREQPATVRALSPDTVRVTFDEPQRAVTPGQALVLYDGDTVIGGGTVARGS